MTSSTPNCARPTRKFESSSSKWKVSKRTRAKQPRHCWMVKIFSFICLFVGEKIVVELMYCDEEETKNKIIPSPFHTFTFLFPMATIVRLVDRALNLQVFQSPATM